jgi:filamentous hemagglutinin family protein
MAALISLVITVYNQERYLGAAIESVLSQTLGDFELLVWDDGSSDRSLSIAQLYACKDSRVRVVAAEHQGNGAALKQAIAQTNGRYIGWVDSDDLLAPTALVETTQVLERESDVGMAYTSYLDIDERDNIVSYGYRCIVPYSKEQLLHQFMTFHFRLIRRSVYEQVGGINELFECAHDYDLCLRLSEKTEVRHVNKPLYYYRTHSNSISRQKRQQQMRDARLAVELAYQRRGKKRWGEGYPQIALSSNLKIRQRTEDRGQKDKNFHSFLVHSPRMASNQNKLGLRTIGSKVSLLAASLLPFTFSLLPSLVVAQPVTDGSTGTNVIQNGDRYDIIDGQLSGNGTNLFHSFSQFDLNQNQIANFVSNPSILNILGRITSGNPSQINGLIQVTGGNSNLFLMNPAGIVFGPNAQLNVPASFHATTANAIGFAGGWFETFSGNNYNNLVGTPSGFRFDAAQPGAIVNAGNLAVNPGQNLSLSAGTIASIGTLQAPTGNVSVTTVPGSTLLRINQVGQLLSLEVAPPSSGQGNLLPITPKMLPELLTGSTANLAPGMTVNASGQAQLTNSGTEIKAGDVAINRVNSGTATLRADRNLTLIESQLATTGNLNLLAGDTVVVRDSPAKAFSARSGGNLYILGSKGIDVLALNHLNQTPFVSGGDLSVVSDGKISLDAHFANKGRFSILNSSGTAGDFSSLYDPIISSVGDVVIGSYNGPSLKIETQGSITVNGTITITEPDDILFGVCIAGDVNCSPDALILANQPALILRAGLTTLQEPALGYPNDVFTFNPTGTPTTPGNVTVTGNINVGFQDEYGAPIRVGGPAIISATGNIQTADINTFATDISFFNDTLEVRGGNVSLQAGGNITTGAINASAIPTVQASTPPPAIGGQVSLQAGGNINFTSINTQGISNGTFGDRASTGGNVSITTNQGVVRGTGVIANSNTTINTGGTTQGGSVTIQHGGGPQNFRFSVGDATNNGLVGAIDTRNAAGIGQFIQFSSAIPDVNTQIPNNNTFVVGNPTVNGISITFINQAPTLSSDSQLTGATQNQTFSFTLASLNPLLNDVNSDVTSIIIDAIAAGTLRRQDGTLIQPGAIVSANEILLYTPPTDATGQITAFTIRASDNVSVSAPQPIAIAVTPTPTITPTPTPTPKLGNPLPEQIPPQKPLFTVNLPQVEIDPVVAQIERSLTRQFQEYIGLPIEIPIKSLDGEREILNQIEKATGIKPAIIYVTFVPKTVASTSENPLPQDSDELELVAVTGKEPPVRKRVTGTTRVQVLKLAQEFRNKVTDSTNRRGYLVPSQQLYKWLVAPLESDLQARQIDNLVFLMDTGLRSLPIAALHDGQSFLIERYSVGLMPSLSLTDTLYKDIRNAQVLAMGAKTFTDQNPLPAVPAEVSAIAGKLWQGKSFLDSSFTLRNLKTAREQQPFGIIHLATHGDFKSGTPNNSYIQLWDTKLRLDQLRQLGWNNPPVELLVLSACRTALGDEQAELGFAGLAVLAGVKSAMASLWYVSDIGTLGLMTDFYQQLNSAPIKAEALRRTQLAMLKGEVRLEDGKLITPGAEISLPPELASQGNQTLEHPYYWSAFTMIGNPW